MTSVNRRRRGTDGNYCDDFHTEDGWNGIFDFELIGRRPLPKGAKMKAPVILTALAASTLLMTAALAQQKLVGNGSFCLKGASGPAKCEFVTMAQCEQARPPGSIDQCVSRSQIEGTTGGPGASDRGTGL